MENAISAGTKEAKHSTARQIQMTKPIKCFNNDSFCVAQSIFTELSTRTVIL